MDDSLSSPDQTNLVRSDRGAPLPASDLVLAWATEKATGKPTYILELKPEHRGLRCGCACPSCGADLEAIKPGQLPSVRGEKRPHFRHPKGTPKDSCLVVSARLAALELLRQSGEFELPRRRRSRWCQGISGAWHQAWVEAPPQKVSIRSYEYVDQTTAYLQLDDGRRVRVLLTGTLERTEDSADGDFTPTLILAVDDPAIAGMSLEEIRSRLRLDQGGLCWLRHWDDQALDIDADAAARLLANDAFDWIDGIGMAGISAAEQRETLLHREVKAILERAGKLQLPEVAVVVTEFLTDGSIFSDAMVRTEEMASLRTVALETKLGRIVPDVIALRSDETEYPALLVEVTVTNKITDERIARIRNEGWPALEIDIGRLGGKITRAGLERLVIEGLDAKTWLFHPLTAVFERTLQAKAIAAEEAVKQLEVERQEALVRPLEEITREYLTRIEALGRCRMGANEMADLDAIEPMTAAIRASGRQLEAHGFPEARSEELFGYSGCMIERLLSIRGDTCIGYRMATAWQVINTIKIERSESRIWHTLYLMAIKVFAPAMTDHQLEILRIWRSLVETSLKGNEPTYRRPRTYDRLLGVLFPEMAEALKLPFGTVEYDYRDAKTVQAAAVAKRTEEYYRQARLLWRASLPSAGSIFLAQQTLAVRGGLELDAVVALTGTLERSMMQRTRPLEIAARWARELGIGQSLVIDFLKDAQFTLQ